MYNGFRKRDSRFHMPVWTVLFLVLAVPAMAQDKDNKKEDGLVAVKNVQFDELYLKPGVSFSGYSKIFIENAPVSYVSGWWRKHRKVVNLRESNRIQKEMADMLHTQLVEYLSRNSGYEIVDEPSPGTLLIKPEIVELNLLAPDRGTGGGRTSIIVSAGYATLSLRFFDAESGELLGRLIDYRESDGIGGDNTPYRATRANNMSEFKQIMTIWAKRVRALLDYVSKL